MVEVPQIWLPGRERIWMPPRPESPQPRPLWTPKKEIWRAAITLVKLGTVASSTTSPVSPAFGQATAAGNFLVAWVGGGGAAAPSTGASGWLQNPNTASNAQSTVWYKPNCSANETAPSFTQSGTVSQMYALLGEFSGVALSSPLDQNNVGLAASPTVMVGADSVAGELLILADFLSGTKSATVTISDSFNNGATAAGLNNGSTKTTFHYDFLWGVTTSNASADSWTFTHTPSTGTISDWTVFLSFKPPAAGQFDGGIVATAPEIVQASRIRASSW